MPGMDADRWRNKDACPPVRTFVPSPGAGVMLQYGHVMGTLWAPCSPMNWGE